MCLLLLVLLPLLPVLSLLLLLPPQVTALVDTFTGPCQSLVGSRQRVWVTDVASDRHHLTGHTRGYVQVRACWVGGGGVVNTHEVGWEREEASSHSLQVGVQCARSGSGSRAVVWGRYLDSG